jgi:hypothetical protein
LKFDVWTTIAIPQVVRQVTYFSATVSETASLPPRHWMACATCISGYACMHHHHAAGSVQEAHSVSTPNKKKKQASR